jgi:hypothetical protein
MTKPKTIPKQPKTDQISQNILANIKDKKPKSKAYFVRQNVLLVAIILAVVLALGLVTGFFLWDSLIAFQNGIGFVLFEILIVVIILMIGLFWLYRQTDFLLVKHRVLVFTLLMMIIFGVGASLVYVSTQNPKLQSGFENWQGDIERLPFRQNRGQMMGKRLKENGVFRGRVIEVKGQINNYELSQNQIPNPQKYLSDYSLITIQNRQETQTFLIYKNILEDINEINQDILTGQIRQNFRVDFERKEVVGLYSD